MIKVYPKNDDIRRLISHPSGVRFRKDGPADWPDDSYTTRRIADGDVTTEQQAQPKKSTRYERHDT